VGGEEAIEPEGVASGDGHRDAFVAHLDESVRFLICLIHDH